MYLVQQEAASTLLQRLWTLLQVLETGDQSCRSGNTELVCLHVLHPSSPRAPCSRPDLQHHLHKRPGILA